MYAKVFSSLFDGSMRGQPDLILVFINMLTRCDSDGCVDRTPRAIADETGLSIERVKDAIKMLESPDPESRTPDMEGRRIVLVSDERTWGWQIVNFRKYRSIRDEQSRRQQNREAQQRYKSKTGKPESAKVSQEKPDKPKKAHTEAEAEAEADTETEKNTSCASDLFADAQSPQQKKQKIIFDGQFIKGYGQEDLDALSKAYPAINVTTEIMKASAWLVANPKNVKKNVARFVNNWLSRAQDKAPATNYNSTPSVFNHPDVARGIARFASGPIIDKNEDVAEVLVK